MRVDRTGPPTDLGFADQPGHPAMLADGSVVMAWVDRFGTRSIRARRVRDCRWAVRARQRDRPLRGDARGGRGPASSERRRPATRSIEMQGWSYGLATPKRCPAGTSGWSTMRPGPGGGIDVRWVRLGVDG